MTNEEIWKMQRAAKALREALPGALASARNAVTDFDGQPLHDGESLRDGCMAAGHLRIILAEIDRLTAHVKQLNADMRDEQREAQHSAGAAYADGRHEGLQEGRGW